MSTKKVADGKKKQKAKTNKHILTAHLQHTKQKWPFCFLFARCYPKDKQKSLIFAALSKKCTNCDDCDLFDTLHIVHTDIRCFLVLQRKHFSSKSHNIAGEKKKLTSCFFNDYT